MQENTDQKNLCIYKLLLQLNTKLFSVNINDRKVVITFAASVLPRKFSKDVMIALIPSELLVYKDLTFRNTKYELSGVFTILSIFLKVTCILHII